MAEICEPVCQDSLATCQLSYEPIESGQANGLTAETVTPSPLVKWLVGVAVCIVSLVYIVPYIDRGWLSHDEGLLAQSAERTLRGELPHRDFDDPYTGGLSFLHATVFDLLGARMVSTRYLLALFTMAFVSIYYWIAARQGSAYFAALITFAGVMWGMTNYFAALPSWYILFTATAGTASLLRFMDTGRLRWIVLAGFCAGLAILMKIVGLYFLAAGLLALAFHEQVSSAARNADRAPTRSLSFQFFTMLLGLVLSSLVLLLIKRDWQVMALTQFALPTIILCTALVVNNWREGQGPFRERFSYLSRTCCCLLFGSALPIIIFLVPYLKGGGLEALFHGVFVLPRMRLDFAREPLPPLNTLMPVAIPTMLLIVGMVLAGRAFYRPTMIAIGLLGLLAWQISTFGTWYYWHFFSIRFLCPVLIAVAACYLVQGGLGRVSARRRQELFLLATVTSLMILLQYPFSSIIYFAYCAPLVLLVLHTLLGIQFVRARYVHAYLLVFLMGFGLTMNSHYTIGQENKVWELVYEVAPARAGLTVSTQQGRLFDWLITIVKKHSRPDQEILAMPDCPEVYFLAERANPTRIMFDFFANPEDLERSLLQVIDERQIPVVVVNQHPLFSPKLSPAFLTALRGRFDRWETEGRFRVGYRSVPDRAPAGGAGDEERAELNSLKAAAKDRKVTWNGSPGPSVPNRSRAVASSE